MLRRNVILAAVIVPLAIVFAGCGPIRVSSHVDGSANFASYHTFTWGPADALPTGDPRLDNNPFFHDYLRGAVERHMREHGITLAQNPADADLLLHYHAAVTQRFDVTSSNQTSSGGYTEPQIIDYDESTIVLDMIDARTNRLAWRGWAQESLQSIVNNQERLKRHIDESVVLMLKRLPKLRACQEEGIMARKTTRAADAAWPAHPGETLVVQRRATDETGEAIAHGSVARVTRRQATDETGETIAGGTMGTESWVPVPDKR